MKLTLADRMKRDMLARRIADGAAISYIGSYGEPVVQGGHVWYLNSSALDHTAFREAVSYLELRGLLIRNRSNRDLVRVRGMY